MNKNLLPSALLMLFMGSIVACSQSSNLNAGADTQPEMNLDEGGKQEGHHQYDLTEQVARMGAVGYSTGGVFSPDAGRIGFVTNASGVPNVWMADADGGNLRQVTHSNDQVGGVSWSPTSGTLAITIAPGGGLNSQIYLLPEEGGEMRMITAGGRVNNWLGDWSDDGRFLTYSSNADSENGMDCWLYDTQTGESRLIVRNQGIGVCTLSPDNTHVLAQRMVSRGDNDLYLVHVDSADEQLLTPHEGVAISHSALFIDNQTVVFATNIGREMLALSRVDIADGVALPSVVLVGREDAELAGIEKLDQNRLLLNWNVYGRSELAYFDLESEEMTAGPRLPAEIAGAPKASIDGAQVLLTASGPAMPRNVWRLDTLSGTFTQISKTPHEGVDLGALVRPELRTYTAHDGLKISGWLYMPHGQNSPGPMVLSFHGGPEAQARPWFNATYQALLSRGIAIFAPNVRGSSGFGKTFVNLDNGRLRFDAIKDIEATMKFVTNARLADPERVGIMGGSYGGYMVMAGITEYPGMFAGAANLFGIVNFETFFANTEPWMAAISSIEYGDPATEGDLLRDLSPIHRIDRIVTPTIVLHGANDTNVPLVEAEQVVEHLRKRDVAVRYVLFPDEGHGWRRTENRVTSDVEIVKWFETHLR